MSTDTILTLALGLPLWGWLLAEVVFGWPGWLDADLARCRDDDERRPW